MVAFIPWSLTVKHSGERAQNENEADSDTEFIVDRHQLSRSLQVTRFHNVCPKNSCHPIV